jgi:hypothetical protein
MQRPCVRIALKWSPRALKTTSTLGRASLAHRSSRLRHLFRIPQSVSPVPLILDRSLSRREFGQPIPEQRAELPRGTWRKIGCSIAEAMAGFWRAARRLCPQRSSPLSDSGRLD